jgi:tetratricopeptide (TPR) repeat protein
MSDNEGHSGRAAITPFWYQLRRVWLYPLKQDPLIVIAIAASLSTFAALFAPFLLVKLMILAYVYRYGSAILVHTASGEQEPPEQMMSFDDSSGWDQIKLLAAFLLIGIIAVLALPQPFQWLVLILLFCGYPAACMLVAMNHGGVIAALNPLKWLEGAFRIGWPYIAIVGLTLAFGFSQEYLERYLTILPVLLREFLTSALGYYFALGSFYLLGYAVYQFQDELGVSSTTSTSAKLQPLPARVDPDQALLDECAALVQAGSVDEAARRIGRQLKFTGGTFAVHERYRKLLTVLGDNAALSEHAQQWLAVLLAQEKSQEAVNLYLDQLKLEPEFLPKDADIWLPLGTALSAIRPDVAILLLRKFGQSFPRSKHVAKHWLLAAQIWVGKKRDYAAGCKMLADIRVQYPDANCIEELSKQEAEWLQAQRV